MYILRNFVSERKNIATNKKQKRSKCSLPILALSTETNVRGTRNLLAKTAALALCNERKWENRSILRRCRVLKEKPIGRCGLEDDTEPTG